MPAASTSLAPPVPDGSALPFVAAEVPRLAAPAPEVFRRTHVRPRRPVVLTGLTDEGWLPPPAWTFARMAERYGDARVIAAELANGTLRDDPTTGVVFRRVQVRAFVDALAEPGSAAHYVMAPVWNFPAAFQDDYRVPAYCTGASHLRVKMWLGKGGTVTPMHRDVPHNLHVHLRGRKRWLLFPPGGAHLYPRGFFSGMPNFSEVDPERPDYAHHPRFRDARAFTATVGPGETLFIPSGWWHHTRTLDDALSMNFWWGGPLVQLASLASTAFKRARNIRRDEWG